MTDIENTVKNKIILASRSPARFGILRNLGIEAEQIPSQADEKINLFLSPSQNVENIAENKIKSVIQKYKDSLIISADTMIYLDNKYLGKPSDADKAKEMLSFISGRVHLIYTGYAVFFKSRTIKGSECTKVKFKKMTDEEICCYIKSGEPFGKAGAYAIQGLGSYFVESIEGDFFNCVGLPVCKMFHHIKDYFGISLFNLNKHIY